MREYLKNYREKRGLTMASVAQKLDVSESYYCLIEKGQRQERMDVVLAGRLATVFEVPIQDIIEQERLLCVNAP